MTDLTFERFQVVNRQRCADAFPMCADWTLNDWAVALVGEAGELCNLLKKIKRGDFTLDEKRADLLKELADVITYADLIVSALGGDTEVELRDKFTEVSQRVGWSTDRMLKPEQIRLSQNGARTARGLNDES